MSISKEKWNKLTKSEKKQFEKITIDRERVKGVGMEKLAKGKIDEGLKMLALGGEFTEHGYYG